MKPANERKQQIFWCDIYPNMERKIMCLFATAPQNKPTYPNKRLWVTIEIPGDAELWPEIFDGKNIDVKKISIENP